MTSCKEQYKQKKISTKISWLPDTTMIFGEHCGSIMFQSMVQCTIDKRTRDDMVQKRTNYEHISMYGMYVCLCVYVCVVCVCVCARICMLKSTLSPYPARGQVRKYNTPLRRTNHRPEHTRNI